MTNITREMTVRSIKIVDIAFIMVLFFAFAYFVGINIDQFFVRLYGTDYEKRTRVRLLIEVLSQVIFIAILSYVGRNVLELVPFPFHRVAGFDHFRMKELKTGAVLTALLFMFQYNMQDKLIHLKNAFMGARSEKTN